MPHRIKSWQQGSAIATSSKMALTHCVECVASLTTLLIMSYLDAQNWRVLNAFKDMITQHYISIGRCARIIKS